MEIFICYVKLFMKKDSLVADLETRLDHIQTASLKQAKLRNSVGFIYRFVPHLTNLAQGQDRHF